MTKKLNLKKKYLLDADSDDENETVEWNDNLITKKYFNCGCCENCLCDNNISCKNCNCSCNCEYIDDDYEIEDSDDEKEDDEKEDDEKEDDEKEDDEKEDDEKENDNDDNDDICKISNLNIKFIHNKCNENKVKITLEINVILSDNKDEMIYLDFDISGPLYVKILKELLKIL